MIVAALAVHMQAVLAGVVEVGIADWLNEHGYSKVCRHNNKREAFTGSFLIGVLDNPVYCGKLAYG